MIKYRVTRDIEATDRNSNYDLYEFSSFTLSKGDIVYHYMGATYGCIGPGGVAVSLDGSEPFGQVPWSALEEVS